MGLFCLLFCSLFSTAQSDYFTDEELEWIKAHPVIRFGYEPDWPPYEIYENGEYSGIVGEYVKILEEETGIDFQPIPDITWDETLKSLREGSIHFVPSCAITDERKKFLDFTSPIVSDPLIIATRRDANFVGSVSYLNHKTVVLPRNYYTQELIRRDYPAVKIIEREKVKDCLEAVSTGEADAFVGSLGVVSYYINHHGFTNLKIAAPTSYRNVSIGMACTKDWGTLRDIAQKVIDQIPVSQHNSIREKWISVRYEHGISQNEFRWYVILSITVIALIAIGFFIWNRTLKREIRKRKKVEAQLSHSLEAIRKQSDERKVLLQEIHHRVKNNLQIISSMLKLQAANSEEHNVPFDYNQTIDRINAISLIHEMIYKSEDISVDNIEAYLNALVKEIISAHAPEGKIHFEIGVKATEINLKTFVPVAIILNELVVNSLKHGFANKKDGNISIQVHSENDALEIEYSDDGQWKPFDKTTNGFGSSLIEIFTEQLEGHYTLDNLNGTKYHFYLKLQHNHN